MNTFIILSIIGIYLLVSVAIGVYVTRKYKIANLADIFTANRSLGLIALAFAVFGSQVTAFGILGGPGLAYVKGYSALGYIVGPFIAAPVAFFVIGYRVWVLGSEKNYLTPVQLFSDRFESKTARNVIAVMQIILLIPYVVSCGIGAGQILYVMSGGAVPYWAGSLLILIISCWTAYSGGMRATAYTNIFQGILIFLVMILMVFFTYKGIGGAEAIRGSLNEALVSLGGKDLQNYKQWIPYSLLCTGISNGVYAHMLVRNMSAKSPKTLQRNGLLYPYLVGGFWVLAVLLGTWGSIAVPGLDVAARENIVVYLAQKFSPVWMMGLLGAGILACIMTSWDGMLLTMASIFSEDLFKPYFYRKREISERKNKSISKIFLIALSALIYLLILLRPASILGIATFSFAGTACLVPAYFACLYWKKASGAGIAASAVAGPLLCALWAFNVIPSSWTFGFFYGLPAFIVGVIVLIVVSYFTQKPSSLLTESFFDNFKKVYDD